MTPDGVTMKTSVGGLRIHAAAAYQRVIADPGAYGPEAARLVERARAARDPEALVAALRAYGWYERLNLRHDDALRLLNEAARLARRHGLTVPLAEVLTSRGAVLHELGRLPAAQRDFDRAGALHAPRLDVDLAVQQAALHQNTGRPAAAAQLYRAILAAAGTPAITRAKAANNLGLIEGDGGRYRVALDCFHAALDAAGEVGPAAVAMATGGLAWGTVQAGRLAEGLARYDEAVRLWTAADLPTAELHGDYADVLADLRLLPEAADQARRALAELDGQPLMAAEAQLRWARLALLTGDHAAAVEAAEAAAARLAAQGRAGWAGRARIIALDARRRGGQLRPSDVALAARATDAMERAGMAAVAVEARLIAGRVAAELGRPRVAVHSWTRAYALSHGTPVRPRMNGRVAAALAARSEGRPDAVLRHARAGLTDLAGHRAALASAELRALASGHGAELGALGLTALVGTGTPTQVLHWMERTRAAALAVVDPAPVAGLEDEVQVLRGLQVELRRIRSELRPEPPELVARLTAVEGRIRRRAWQRTADLPAGSQRLPGVGELRRALAGRPLVEYEVLEGRLLAAVLEPRRTRLVRLGPLDDVRDRLDWLLFALRRLTRASTAPVAVDAARAMATSALADLRTLLVTPLGLPPAAGVVVCPVRDLQRAPWSALLDLPVSVAPSAGLWLRSARQVPVTDRVALVAGPDLPGALAEVRELSRRYPDAVVLVPPDSRLGPVAAAVDGAALAHLACHGLLRADNPTFSALLLADGQVTLHELDQWVRPPHRLVLASCRSGSDVSYPGNESLGFVGTLLARGTAGLVASTVDVPDLGSTPLLRLLHEALPGRGLADGLFAARGALAPDDPADFVSRCAYTAYGAG